MKDLLIHGIFHFEKIHHQKSIESKSNDSTKKSYSATKLNFPEKTKKSPSDAVAHMLQNAGADKMQLERLQKLGENTLAGKLKKHTIAPPRTA
jgi:hypothetical protein